MKNLFLTSSVHAVANNISKKLNLSTKNKLVFITTPAELETGDMSWLANDRKALVDAGFKVTDYTITGKNLEQLKNDLKDYDFIYLSGGNTFYLLRESHKTGFFDLIKDLVNDKGKIYIGTSAGSIITGPICPDYLLSEEEVIGLEGQRGYGFVDFTILPHWGSKDFKDLYLKDRLSMAYKTDQVPLIALTDNQYIHVEGDKYEFVDVAK